jgi:hypothetical protein
MSPPGPDGREFGDIGARLKIVEDELAKARIKLHKQAQTLQSTSIYVKVLQGLPERVDKLEKWRSFEMGAAAVIGGLISFAIQYVLRRTS